MCAADLRSTECLTSNSAECLTQHKSHSAKWLIRCTHQHPQSYTCTRTRTHTLPTPLTHLVLGSMLSENVGVRDLCAVLPVQHFSHKITRNAQHSCGTSCSSVSSRWKVSTRQILCQLPVLALYRRRQCHLHAFSNTAVALTAAAQAAGGSFLRVRFCANCQCWHRTEEGSAIFTHSPTQLRHSQQQHKQHGN